jgi:dTDP-4-amino-4,6-dideoxygalactose transaminase
MTGRPTTDTDPTAPPIPSARIVFTGEDRGEIAERVSDALRTGVLTLGENTRQFEAAFAHAHQARFAVAVASGTAALEIILRALDVAGREVVVPTNTFAATAFAVMAAGAMPVFADIDPKTGALDVAGVEAVLSERTAAVVLVHIAGLINPDVTVLRALCDQRGIGLVEDAAHAHGCRLGDAYAGSFGVAAAFSFYPTKVITTGEGGAIVTSSERIRDEAMSYRDQGKASFLSNLHVRRGYAWRMSELHAAVGLVQLRHLDEFIATREEVARKYDNGLSSIPWLTPLQAAPALRCNYYKYPVLLDRRLDRTALKAALKERFQITLSGEVYDTPLHRQPVFEPFARGQLPCAERFCAHHVCLPVHSDMTEREVERVLKAAAAVCRDLVRN